MKNLLASIFKSKLRKREVNKPAPISPAPRTAEIISIDRSLNTQRISRKL